MEDDSECNVCCEKLRGKGKLAKVCCKVCDFLACRTCVEAYLLSDAASSVTGPHCMKCRKAWNRATLFHMGLTKAFVNGALRKVTERRLWEAEQARLPEAQSLAETMVRLREIEAQYRSEKLERLEPEIYWGRHRPWRDTQKSLRLVKRQVDALIRGDVMPDSITRRFIQRCPRNACNGFVDTSFRCGMCQGRICKSCHVAVEQATKTCPAHECDPVVLESVRVMAHDTKACPKCAVPIFKIDGCDQMWCTTCHTAFSWTTGHIVHRGRVHNPHFYTFMREQSARTGEPLRPGPVNLDLCPDMNELPAKQEGWSDVLKNAWRVVSAIRDRRMHAEPEPTNNIKLRALHLMGMSAKETQRRVFLNARANTRRTEVATVLSMVCMCVINILERWLPRRVAPRVEAELESELEHLRVYANASLRDIATMYAVGAVQITSNYKVFVPCTQIKALTP